MSRLTFARPQPRSRSGRAGFSLTELLVASGIGLIVMASVASLFTVFGRALTQSQSTVDQVARLRAAAWKLRQDLAGVTCRVTPWLSPDAEAGYFECVEGPRKDNAAPHSSSNLEADTDDILMFTTRAPAGKFFGRYADTNRTIESPYAEVAWFCRPAPTQPVAGTRLYNLHRRQLLVIGYAGTAEFAGNAIGGTLPNNDYDISLRSEGGRLVPNTLGELTKRENRFMHMPGFPHVIQTDTGVDANRLPRAATFEGSLRDGEDLVLTNVISFDVRVFDVEARAQVSGTITRYPGDPGYGTGSGAFGAYVDLWGGQGGRLARQMEPKCGLPPARPTYDTWSEHYEVVRSTTPGGRAGVNSIDDCVTSPPYPVPLEGVEVRIRCYDPTSKQVRQVTVRQSFGPR